MLNSEKTNLIFYYCGNKIWVNLRKNLATVNTSDFVFQDREETYGNWKHRIYLGTLKFAALLASNLFTYIYI